MYHCTHTNAHTPHCVHHCQNKWNVGSIRTYMLSKLLYAHSVVMRCCVCALLAALLCWSREISPSKATAIKITCVCFNLCNWLTGRVHVCVLQVHTAVAKFSKKKSSTQTPHIALAKKSISVFFFLDVQESSFFLCPTKYFMSEIKRCCHGCGVLPVFLVSAVSPKAVRSFMGNFF